MLNVDLLLREARIAFKRDRIPKSEKEYLVEKISRYLRQPRVYRDRQQMASGEREN